MNYTSFDLNNTHQNDYFNLNFIKPKLNINLLNFITITFLYSEMILCYILNSASFICIIHMKAFTPINILILNLALADMLYASCIPFYVSQFRDEQPVSQSKIGCQISFILDVSSMIVIVFTIAALTLERYFCIKEKKIMENDKSKTKLIAIYIVILWLLAICYTLPKGLSIKEEFYENVTICGSTMSQFHEKINAILKWILSFAFPYTIIIVNSILLLKFLKEWSNKSKKLKYQAKPCTFQLAPLIKNKDTNYKNKINITTANNDVSDKQTNENCNIQKIDKLTVTSLLKHEAPSKTNSSVDINHGHKTNVTHKTNRSLMIKRRTTRFVLAIVFSFLCCWSPLWIYQIIIIFSESESVILQVMSNVSLIVVYMGGVIDPLLYMILTQNFREFLSKMFKNATKPK